MLLLALLEDGSAAKASGVCCTMHAMRMASERFELDAAPFAGSYDM